MVEDLFEIQPPAAGSDGTEAIVLRVHVQPGAGRTAVSGRYGDALKVRAAAPPEGGRATAASRAFLAELLGAKEAQAELTRAESSRSKPFRITGLEPGHARRILQR